VKINGEISINNASMSNKLFVEETSMPNVNVVL